MKAHEYVATVDWKRDPDAPFTDNRYSRAHEWRFDGGTVVPASSSPLVVKAPYSNVEAVDPEEAFVASLSSCHMLFFLHHARDKGLVINRYVDEAFGTMGRGEDGSVAMLKVVLRPQVEWQGSPPAQDVVDELHHRAHKDCFIANSVRTEVTVESRG